MQVNLDLSENIQFYEILEQNKFRRLLLDVQLIWFLIISRPNFFNINDCDSSCWFHYFKKMWQLFTSNVYDFALIILSNTI